MRVFIVKESLESMPQCRRTLRRLYILDRFVTYLFYGLVFWFLWTYIDRMMSGLENIFSLPVKMYQKHSRFVLDVSG